MWLCYWGQTRKTTSLNQGGDKKRNFTLTHLSDSCRVEKECTWTLVPRTKVAHNHPLNYFCIQRIVRENVENETSTLVNATCVEFCWCWCSRILILHVIANWGRWFIMTGLAMFFQETPPRQRSPGSWYICNTFGNSMCPEKKNIYI